MKRDTINKPEQDRYNTITKDINTEEYTHFRVTIKEANRTHTRIRKIKGAIKWKI